ncbi:MAG: MBG domain-containing protein, partial [Akkermansiaceae bacterium]|nr:MBG domain-containing protein [Akkermansiaceae bacterium]
SALLSDGAASVAGNFTFADPSRVPSAGTANQTAVFTPSSNNYESLNRAISVTVRKASATVSLGNLTATYDGTPKVVSASTTPSGLSVALTYNGTSTAPVNAGNYAVNAVIVDLNYAGTGSGQFAILGMNYSSWQEQEFSPAQILADDAAVAADPDGDGLVNLVEYGLGTNPLGFTRLPPPVVDAGFLSMTFDRPVGRPDVVCDVEASSDLVRWVPVSMDVTAQTATTQTVCARIARPADQGRMFLRLKFQENP